MSNAKRVLVYGATGVQGGATLRKLVADGFDVRAIVRSEQGAAAVRKEGATPAIASLEAPDTLIAASEGVDAVALVLPLQYDRKVAVPQGLHAIEAAKKAGVSLIVLNASGRIPSERTDIEAFELKREIEAALFASGVPAISLRATFYMENLAGPWTAPAIVKDSTVAYPIPAELRASWVSAADMGAFVSAAIQRPELAGEAYDVGGPEALSGNDIAAVFSAALGRRISYFPIPVDAFEAQLSAAVGPHAGQAIAKAYRWMGKNLDSGLFQVDAAALRRTFNAPWQTLESWVKLQNWSALVPR